MVIKKRKIRKYKGGGMDASKSDFGVSTGNASNKGSDHSHTRFNVGSGFYGETRTKTGGSGGTTVNTPPKVNTPPQNTGLKINPVTTGLNIAGALIGKVPFVGYAIEGVTKIGKAVQKKTRTQTAKGETLFGNVKPGNKGMPITRDYYRTTGKPLDVTSKEGTAYMKEAGFLKRPKTTSSGGGDGPNVQLCPDGTYPPCKTPATQIKTPIKKPNTFLSGFQAYDDGGEVVISSNVDKSLL